jgi:hypothetical protein
MYSAYGTARAVEESSAVKAATRKRNISKVLTIVELIPSSRVGGFSPYKHSSKVDGTYIMPVQFGVKATEHGRSRHLDDRALRMRKKRVSFIAAYHLNGKKICMMEEGWLQTDQDVQCKGGASAGMRSSLCRKQVGL